LDLNLSSTELVVTVVGALSVLFLPRKYVLVPFLIIIVFIPMARAIVISGLDFKAPRILILCGLARIILRNERSLHRWNSIDKAVIAFQIFSIVVYTLREMTSDALIGRLGICVDMLGAYLVVRYFVVDLRHVKRAIATLGIICMFLVPPMVYERVTSKNLFRVSDYSESGARDGKVRVKGPFGHPITMGTFGAMWVPMFYGFLFRSRRSRTLGILSITSATAITFLAASSGPLITYGAGLLGAIMWRFRGKMRAIRWGIVFTLIGLHLVMTAPVWALLQRVTIFDSSKGGHRFRLFDQFINRFDEWWLLGSSSTSHWGYYLFDVTNWYVRIGVDGGFITLVAFLVILALCFRNVGRAVHSIDGDVETQKKLWMLGATLFSQIVTLMGVSYWDQLRVLYFVLIALITVATSAVLLKQSNLEDIEPSNQYTPDLPIPLLLSSTSPIFSFISIYFQTCLWFKRVY